MRICAVPNGPSHIRMSRANQSMSCTKVRVGGILMTKLEGIQGTKMLENTKDRPLDAL